MITWQIFLAFARSTLGRWVIGALVIAAIILGVYSYGGYSERVRQELKRAQAETAAQNARARVNASIPSNRKDLCRAYKLKWNEATGVCGE